MPALFAYLLALSLLFGAGYGALNWLAQPEPVKVAAKAKSKTKSQPAYQAPSQEVAEAAPQAGKSDETSASPKSSGSVHDEASASRNQQVPVQAVPSVTVDDRGTQPVTAAPAAANEIRSASAEMPADEERRKAEPTVKPSVSTDPPRNLQPNASPAPATTEKTSKRPHSRQAGTHSERRPLTLMTLRTIEFPDGRRITQLIPLQRRERLSARIADDR
jgi:hypothetical protein